MIIKSLQVKNFRNYADESVSFGDGVNVLYGKNASGKTNLLEAVYMLAVGKSPRTSKDKELIRFEAEKASVRAEIQKKYRSHKIEISLEGNSKKVLLDGLPISRLSELIGVFNIVYFSPDELKFIKETPAERRRFLDISLCQQSKTYYMSLLKYNKILQQRNKLLKTDNRNPSLPAMLSIWDAQLSEYGANLISARRAYVKKLQGYAEGVHSELTDKKELLTLSYETGIEATKREEVAAELAARLAENVTRDAELMFTSLGPHRDDIKIAVNNLDARKFASQGQQRSAALSVKIAELDLFKAETGEAPVLLLDDVLSELDERRSLKLLELANRTQTLITCTEFAFKTPKQSKQFKIESGTIL